jgi:protein-S-isoprenylcysteine O-methyltransferase Ste14
VLGQRLFRARGWVPVPFALLLIVFARSPAPWMTILGGSLLAVGEALRLWGVAHIGPSSRTRGDDVGVLIETGPFAWSRNPLYVGNLLLWWGVGWLSGRPLLAAVVVLVLAVHYRFVVAWEEENLRERLGAQYIAYVARVSRWFGGRRSTTADGSADWAGAFRSERSTLLAASLVIAAIQLRVVVGRLA